MSDYSLKRYIKSTLKLDSYKADYRLNKLPSYLHETLIGLLLSDGSVERPSKTGGARLSVILGFDTLPYLMHLYNLFEPFIDNHFSISEVNNRQTGNAHSIVRFRTCMSPIFVYYHNMFYKFDDELNRYVKIVPKDIDNLMTPVVLAHLIMGDGNLKKGDNIIRIYTNSFTKTEVEHLAFVITNKLGIITKAVHDRKGQYMLTISKSQLDKVKSLIEPYMHPSMLYKLGISAGQVGFNISNILDKI